MKFDAAVHPLLEYALHLVVEAGETVERLLEGQEIIAASACARSSQRSPGTIDADARRVDQCEGGRDAARALLQRQVVHLVGDQRLVGLLRRHRELGEARRSEAKALQFLDFALR